MKLSIALSPAHPEQGTLLFLRAHPEQGRLLFLRRRRGGRAKSASRGECGRWKPRLSAARFGFIV